MRKQKRIMICFCLLLGMSMVGCGVLKGFDAEAYTEAVLKQRLSGDTKEIARLTEEMSEEELAAQYEKEVQTFVAGYITKDVSMGEELTEKYTALCSEIFKSLKYETAKAEKKDKNTYDVNETPDGFWKRTVFETRVFKSNHYLYPFSQRELDRNKILTQNYGW